MTATTHSALATRLRFQFVNWTDLTNWSVRFALENRFNYNPAYELRALGSFLQRVKTEVVIQDKTTYQRVTVRVNNRGVVPRDTEIGRSIGTKRQFQVAPGQFLLSRIDARHGAMGLVPPELAGAVVTADFLAFEIDQSQINSDFLVLITSTPEFIRFCQNCSSGTTNRQRLDGQAFLDVKIPLPTLAVQRQLAAAYYAKTQAAQQQRAEADKNVKEAEEYLIHELGVSIKARERTTGKLQFVNFSDLDRWDTAYALQSVKMRSAYPEAPLTDFIAHFMRDTEGGSVRINTSDSATQNFRYVGMENVEKNTGNLVEAPLIKGKEIKSQTLRVLPGFFIYGKLRPYLNKYWRNTTNQKDVVCSSEFFVFSLNDTINADYFLTVLRSEIIQRQIQDNTSGARMPRMNESTFLSLKIPVPTIAKQVAIAQVFEQAAANRDNRLLSADALEAAAVAEFQADIFATNVHRPL